MTSRRHAAAFTMVELMVALAVAIIVTVGLYSLYTTYVKSFIAQDRVIETQQAARIAVDTLTQDLMRGGYKIEATVPAITLADTSQVEIQLFNDLTNSTERVRYRLAGTDLVREILLETAPGVWTVQTGVSGVLVEHVMPAPDGSPALEFTYYTQAAIEADPASPAPLPIPPGGETDPGDLVGIRRVQATVTVRSGQVDPVRNAFVYRTLRLDVKPRNAGLMATIRDLNAPAVPTGLASIDRGDCGYLYLSWDENTEPDLAGYIVYYRTDAEAPGAYLKSVTVGRGVPHSTTQPYVLAGLADSTQYSIAISAFDYSGNTSGISGELTGTAGSTDTRPNVADPDQAPGSLVAAPGDNRVSLSWTRVAEPDVVGYRIFRKTSPFTSSDYSSIAVGDYAGAQTLVVANEASPGFTVTGDSVGYVDASETLRGCIEYHYAVTAIKGCPGTTHPTTTYTPALFASAGPAAPTDSVPPQPAPSPAMLTAFPSYLRNYVSLTNPPTTDPVNKDFLYSRVAYRIDGAYPTFAVDGSGRLTTNGIWVECRDEGFGPGSVVSQGTTNILHRGTPCDTAYHLDPSVTYYYAAVAVDTCKNLSNPATTNAQVTATQCSDETEAGHPAVGNPPRINNIRGNTARSAGGVKTSAALLAWNPVDDSFTGIRDFAGYYVARKPVLSTSESFPALSDIWLDPKAPGLLLSPVVFYSGLEEGKIDRARILGVDCETVTKDDASHAFLVSRYPSSEFDARASDTLIFYPGTIELDAAVSTRTLGKTNNVVEFRTRTTMNPAATDPGNLVSLKGLVFDWTVLNSGAGKDRLLTSVTIDGRKKTLASPLASPATIGALADDGNPLGVSAGTSATIQLEFISSTTGNPSKASMRDLWIRTALLYVPVTRLNSDTAAPFVFNDTQQALVAFDVPQARGPDILDVRHRRAGTTDSLTPATTIPPSTFGGPITFAANYQIEVVADVVDNSGKGIDQAILYFATTSRTFPPSSGAPLLGSDFPNTIGASYTPVTMTCSSGVCQGTIPVRNNLRVWFFILVRDGAGNYSVSPAQETVDSNVTYVYDQAGGLL